MRSVHNRLREALNVTREAARADVPAEPAARELLLFCRGFCTALTGHHVGEDSRLFPAIAAAHPELRDTLRYLEQDHSMIAHLISGLEAAITGGGTAEELNRHLEGISAIMESHFRYEERKLLDVLEGLDLADDVADVFGPL